MDQDQDFGLSKLRPTEPRGSIYLDQYYSEESGDEGKAPRLVAKKIKKLGYRKKKYKIITNKMREELIDAIENQNEKIKDAAKRLHMNYSSAKSILQVYKKEGRLNKKGFRRKSNPRQEFSEDEDGEEEDDEEVFEKVEFVKQESSPLASNKTITASDDNEVQNCEESTVSSQRVLRAKTQLLPKQKSPCVVASVVPIKENILTPESIPAQSQYVAERGNYLGNPALAEMSQFNFLPSSAVSMKNNFAAVNNNSFYSKMSPYNNTMMNMPPMGFPGLYPSNPAPVFKNGGGMMPSVQNFTGIQKPMQKNSMYQRQENPVFVQNLIQTSFFPSQYLANNGYLSSLLLNSGRPATNQLVSNFGMNANFENFAQFTKIEESDI